MIPKSNFISASANALVDASRLANDSKACAVEARRIYGRDCRGMWKSVMMRARKCIAQANEHGLTLEKPYKVINGVVWCVSCTTGNLFPAF